jgi:hypothetical protein
MLRCEKIVDVRGRLGTIGIAGTAWQGGSRPTSKGSAKRLAFQLDSARRRGGRP